MTDIFFGVFAFTLIIVVLVLILMAAKAKLVASGEVSIAMNDDPDATIHCASGQTLLGTLADISSEAQRAGDTDAPTVGALVGFTLMMILDNAFG